MTPICSYGGKLSAESWGGGGGDGDAAYDGVSKKTVFDTFTALHLKYAVPYSLREGLVDWRCGIEPRFDLSVLEHRL